MYVCMYVCMYVLQSWTIHKSRVDYSPDVPTCHTLDSKDVNVLQDSNILTLHFSIFAFVRFCNSCARLNDQVIISKGAIMQVFIPNSATGAPNC